VSKYSQDIRFSYATSRPAITASPRLLSHQFVKEQVPFSRAPTPYQACKARSWKVVWYPGNDLLSRQKPLSSASVVSRPCSRWERVGPTDYVHREYDCLAVSYQLSAISQTMSLAGQSQAFRRCIKKGDAKAECEQLDQDLLSSFMI
jgi:hypothetical protein